MATMSLRAKVIRLAHESPELRPLLLPVLAARSDQTAKYKGREYRLLYMGPTRYGEKAKLGFMDGSKEFWVDAKLVTVLSGSSYSRPSGGGGSGKATPKQVEYALRLIRRLGRHGWHDSDYGQAGGPPPTERELEKMSARDISDLIDSLKNEY